MFHSAREGYKHRQQRCVNLSLFCYPCYNVHLVAHYLYGVNFNVCRLRRSSPYLRTHVFVAAIDPFPVSCRIRALFFNEDAAYILPRRHYQ